MMFSVCLRHRSYFYFSKESSKDIDNVTKDFDFKIDCKKVKTNICSSLKWLKFEVVIKV